MKKAVLFLSLLVAGCQGGVSGGGPAAVTLDKPDLLQDNGRWLSTQKEIKTEWSFKPDGTYEALHQEGEVAAQIRGKYRWDNGFLVLDPNPDSIEARSRDAEEAKRVQDRISKGYELAITMDGKEKFTAKPNRGGEKLVFTRHQG
ncbi:MAG: hypothetical protein ACO1SV_00025 [Fimbriimonas sp.]